MVPLQANLEIESVSADIDVDGVAPGELEIDTVSGNVTVAAAPRRAEVQQHRSRGRAVEPGRVGLEGGGVGGRAGVGLAGRLGVTPNALYRHLGSRDELHVLAVEQVAGGRREVRRRLGRLLHEGHDRLDHVAYAPRWLQRVAPGSDVQNDRRDDQRHQVVGGRGAGGQPDAYSPSWQPVFGDDFLRDADGAMPDTLRRQQAIGLRHVISGQAGRADAGQVAGVAAVVAADHDHRLGRAQLTFHHLDDGVLPLLGGRADRVEGAEVLGAVRLAVRPRHRLSNLLADRHRGRSIAWERRHRRSECQSRRLIRAQAGVWARLARWLQRHPDCGSLRRRSGPTFLNPALDTW